MRPLLYDQLVDWYRLLDPPEDHADEAALYRAAFQRSVVGPLETFLELGCGGGHNATYLGNGLGCTLTDISEPMLGLSRELNPQARHVRGDMRYLQLGETFDAVLVHDAIVYMTNHRDLHAALQTAYLHTRPGGVAIVAPDHFTETFKETTSTYEANDGKRSLRALEWSWDPDPADNEMRVDYAFLLRDEYGVHSVHDQHLEGLFSRAMWLELLSGVGFQVELIHRPVDDHTYTTEIFLCRRPLS